MRRGLAQGGIARPWFSQQTSSGGARTDLTDVADALDLLDEPGTGVPWFNPLGG